AIPVAEAGDTDKPGQAPKRSRSRHGVFPPWASLTTIADSSPLGFTDSHDPGSSLEPPTHKSELCYGAAPFRVFPEVVAGFEAGKMPLNNTCEKKYQIARRENIFFDVRGS